MENRIDVYYKKRHVGTLARLKNKYAFQYSEEWLKDGFSISPFSLPLKKGLFIPAEMTYDGFYGVFADSLPDAWGKLLLERFLRKKGIRDVDGLYRLAMIGNSGMGALEYIPDISVEKNEFPDLDEYQRETEKILENSEGENIDFLYRYGGSSGGARPKALVKINDEPWIIKFQSRYDIKNSGVCEYKYSEVCRELGINMPETKLFESKMNDGYFGIKRFDRKENEKIHMISAASLLEADFKTPCADYLDLFKLTKIVTRDNKEDLENLYLRMCFNVAAHNLDDHLKNFSYLYDEDRKCYRLSPAYDMTYSNTYYGEHTTSVNHKGKDIEALDLIYVGVSSGLKKEFCQKMEEFVRKTVERDLKEYLK